MPGSPKIPYLRMRNSYMPNSSQIISYLPPDSYKAFLGGAPDGNVGKTHLAEIIWDDDIQRESWVKIYTSQEPRSLINEMIGYLLGTSLELPMPSKAGFLLIETKALHPHLVHQLSEVDQYRGYTFAWTTEDVKGKNPRIEIMNNPEVQAIMEERFIACMTDWDFLPHMIAFDDWIINTDRNLGNTIQLPDNTFSLIDHGESLHGRDWKEPDLLDANCPHIGFLNNLYLRCLHGKYKKDGLFQEENTLRALEQAKTQHHAAFDKVKEEIQQHLDDMIGDEQVETGIKEMASYPVSETVMKFLLNRAKEVRSFNGRCDNFLGMNSKRPMS